MNIIKNKSMIKIITLPILVILLIIGLSYVGTDKKNNNELTVDPNGFNQLFADSVGWGGVIGAATLLRAVNRSFNAFYTTISTWGIFRYQVSIDSTVPNTSPAITFKIRINDPADATGTVDSSAVTYSNRLEISVGGTQALQLWFDDPNDASGGDGSLLIVKPEYFTTTCIATGGIFEARVKTSGLNKIMYITFQGTPWTTGSAICGTTHSWPLSGRGKLVDDGTNYDVTAVVKSHVDGTLPYINCSLAAGDAYYTLAFRAYKAFPNNCTALYGWDNSGKLNTQCGFNLYNKGYFNSSGFVDDQVASTGHPIRADYPVLADIDTLYSGMASTAQEFSITAIDTPAIVFPTF